MSGSAVVVSSATGAAGVAVPAPDASGCSTGSVSRNSIGLPASSLRFQVTCSPSSHLIFTDTALAQVIRPSTPSSVQRTRLPMRIVARLPAVGVFFFLPMFSLLGRGS